MADQRKAPIKKEAVAKAVRARKIRVWGGVAVGVTCIVLALWTRENTVGLMVVACAGFGVETIREIAKDVLKR